MHDSSRTYFEDRIRTAAPERLQFMLLESALQAARRAEQFFVADRPLQAGGELAHVEAILAEIVGAMRKDAAPELVERCASVYAFMIQRLTEAHLNHDVQAARDVIRVLEVECETWRLVCERAAAPAAANTAKPPAPHLPSLGGAQHFGEYAAGGFSAEA